MLSCAGRRIRVQASHGKPAQANAAHAALEMRRSRRFRRKAKEVNDFADTLRRIEKLKADAEQRAKDLESGTRRIRVNKKTQRIRFEDETEEGVTIIIERQGD